MRFLVDECFPKRLVEGLVERGHDVVWVSDVCRSADDTTVLATANAQGRIIVTEDKDYGDLTVRDGHPAVGIVLANAESFPGGLAEAIDALVVQIDGMGERLVGALTVIEPARIRQRMLMSVKQT